MSINITTNNIKMKGRAKQQTNRCWVHICSYFYPQLAIEFKLSLILMVTTNIAIV